jgi:phage-related minor tail protein
MESGSAAGAATGFAGGGTVQAGVPIPVGERGPEMFVPNVGGNIVSNSALGGGGAAGNVHIQVTNNGTAQQVKSATPTMSGKDYVIQIVMDDMRTGGPMSQGMQSKFGLNTKSYL